MSEQLDEIFLPGGILDRSLDSYCFREGQLEMAGLIEEAFESGRNAIIEAGTGTGKSFAYLAPAMQMIKREPHRKVVIATSTITLEKQLYEKDIPFLAAALGFKGEVAILFGRSNYACKKKFVELKETNPVLLEDPSSYVSALAKWLSSTETGERGEIRSFSLLKAFSYIASDDKTCRGPRCPFYLDCFYFNARRNALRSKLLVTNHHLLLIDGKHRMECGIDFEDDAILPSYDAVVVDEAHHMEAEATELLSREYGAEKAEMVLDLLVLKDSSKGVSLLESLSLYDREPGGTRKVMEEIRRARSILKLFDDRISMTFGALGADEILFDRQVFSRYQNILSTGEAVAEALRSVSSGLYTLYKEDVAEEDLLSRDNVLRYADELVALSDTLRDFIRFNDFSSAIAHASGENGLRYVLKISPMEVGPILRSTILDNIGSAVFCSATLSLNRSFEYFKTRLGLDDSALEGIYESPFRYKENLMLLLPSNGMAYNNLESQSYVDYTVEAVKEAILYSGGGALILFTSRQMLEEVHRRVSEALPDFLLLSQVSGGSRTNLLKKFKEDEDSSLFATSSFWEGVDAPGNTLRLVVIVKLPFTVPSTPIYRARCAHLEEEGRFPFLELTVPEAAIKLKQGFGRLIRSETDKGIVLILDSRLLTKGYGRILLSSLPECYIPEDTTLENLGGKIENFLY